MLNNNESLLLRDLRNYYDKVGILSTDFRCKHLENCRKCGSCGASLPLTPQDADDATNTFTPAKSSFVGKFYEDASALRIPRLMFVSLDPGRSIRSGEERTPEFIRESTRGGSVRRNPHWRQTCNLAVDFFQDHHRLRDLSQKEAVEYIVKYFAHVNAVKCCQNKQGKNEADRHLFVNCRDYLCSELQILAPDIIVTQGKKARNSIGLAFSIDPLPELGAKQEISLGDSGKKAYWFPSCHPASYGPYKKEEKRRNEFVNDMRTRFML